MFYRLFYYMEHHDLLDPIDEVHLYALHYVYMLRVNRSIQLFKEAWNNHGIRTEQGMTPNQLFASGALQLRESGLSAVDFFDDVTDIYGSEETGSGPADSEGVAIPSLNIQLTEMQLDELHQTVDLLSDSNDFGIDLYLRTVTYVQSATS